MSKAESQADQIVASVVEFTRAAIAEQREPPKAIKAQADGIVAGITEYVMAAIEPLQRKCVALEAENQRLTQQLAALTKRVG